MTVKDKEKTAEPSFLEQIKVSQDFAQNIQTTTTLVPANLRFDKPPKKAFFRVMGDEDNKPKFFQVGVLEFEEGRERYIVHPSLHAKLYEHLQFRALYVYVTRHKMTGVWPVGLAKGDQQLNSWPRSAHQIASDAVGSWVQMCSGDGSYYANKPQSPENFPEPEWPEIGFHEIIEMAVKERYIDSMDHKVVKQLYGIE